MQDAMSNPAADFLANSIKGISAKSDRIRLEIFL